MFLVQLLPFIRQSIPLTMPVIAKSYRQKNLLLLAGVLLLGIIVFKFNIQRTFKEYKQYKENKAKLTLASTASSQITAYKEQLASLQQTAIAPYNRENLLERVTAFCRTNNLLVKSFPEEEVFDQKNGSQVITNRIEVEGGYKAIVKLVYNLEEIERLGSVNSLRFSLQKDRVLKKWVLRGYIVFRNLKPQP